jgi:thioester reductase-like protein
MWLCQNREFGRVVAIVRGTSDEQAAQRLRSGYESGDNELLSVFNSLSAKHLIVLAGARA